jgi:hypothetical protein
MPARPWPGASDLEVQLAAYGIGPETPPAGWLAAPPWADLIGGCRRRQLLPLLARAIADGARVLDTAERADLRQQLADELGASVILERELLHIVHLLEAEGITYRVLKGVANAHLDYPRPAERVFGDLDVLVAADHIELAKAVLEAHGYTRDRAERRAGFDARYEKSLTFVSPAGNAELDLHRTFVSGPLGHCFDPADLLRAPDWFDLAGQRLPALGREDRFVHACVSATISDATPRLRPARDVVQLLVHPDLDVDATVERSSRLGMGLVVARAVDQSVEGLGVTAAVGHHPLLTWAHAYQPSGREEARWACYVGDRRSYVRKAWGALREIDGLGPRAGYALAMLRPDRDAVARPLTTRVKQGVTALRTRGDAATPSAEG